MPETGYMKTSKKGSHVLSSMRFWFKIVNVRVRVTIRGNNFLKKEKSNSNILGTKIHSHRKEHMNP